MERPPSLVSAVARTAVSAAPYAVVALYTLAEALVATLAIGRRDLLVTAIPVAAAALAGLAIRRRRRATSSGDPR